MKTNILYDFNYPYNRGFEAALDTLESMITNAMTVAQVRQAINELQKSLARLDAKDQSV